MSETVLQFGAGNFLRGFVDTFLHEMNEAGLDAGRVVIVQSTGVERAAAINSREGRFHLLVRGFDDGALVDYAQAIGSISRALAASSEWPEIVTVAVSPQLRAIVSNTTEAGLALDLADTKCPAGGVAPASFPAKLLALLRARYDAGRPGLLILPCELIADNADVLRTLVERQAALWAWTEPDFHAWLAGECVWVNTLVDRIVAGKPVEHPLLDTDPLLTVAEPYAYWAIEDKPGTEWLGQHPAIYRLPDIRPVALRKVRILNGAHTALVTYLRQNRRDDIQLVREAVSDPEIGEWLRGLIFEEIVPTITDRLPDAEGYARLTLERFANPLLDHRLSDIALHHDTKVGVRLVPTYDEYRTMFSRSPERLDILLTAFIKAA